MYGVKPMPADWCRRNTRWWDESTHAEMNTSIYEAPFTKASVVVGIETVTLPAITRRAW